MHDAVHIKCKANTFASVCDVFDGRQTQRKAERKRERERGTLAKSGAKMRRLLLATRVPSTYFQSCGSVVLFWSDRAYSGTHLLPH